MKSFDSRVKAAPRAACVWLTAVLLFFSSAGLLAQSQDWPQWRGPRADGISDGTGWNPNALAGGTRILWTADVGYGYSNVAIRGNRLYATGTFMTGDVVVCLDAGTGAEVWKRRMSEHPSNFMAMSTPTLDGEWLYVLLGDGSLSSIRAADGVVRWTRNVMGDYGVEKLPYGCATSPVVEGGMLMLNFNVSGIAVEETTGKLIWASELYGPTATQYGHYATPVVVDRQGTRCALFLGSTRLSLVETRTGRRIWSIPVPTDFSNIGDPIVCGASVFVSTMSNSSFSELASTDDGKVVWSGDLGNIAWSAICLRGFLYETVSDKAMRARLQCADMSNGKLMWEKAIKMPTFTEASDKLIILDEDGILHIAEATPKGYQELSSGDSLGGRDDVARKFWTPPVLVGGRLFCRNYEGQLVCIEMRK